MGFLDKLFGRSSVGGVSVESAVESMLTLYDQPDVKAEGGLSITGPHAKQVRELGRGLAKTGGKEAMTAACDGIRDRVPWAIKNVEAIWASLPEWKN